MNEYALVRVIEDADWRDYHALRRMILWEARGLASYDDKYPDEYLPNHYPLLLKWKERAIGTTRLDDFGDRTGAARLVTIAAGLQGQGHGRILSERVDDFARRLKLTTLFVNAAPEAIGFYQKTGWEPYVWDEAELVGIAADCHQMRKILPA